MNRLITVGGEKVYLGSRPDLWIPQGTSEWLEKTERFGPWSHRKVGGAKWTTQKPGLPRLVSHCLGSVSVLC